MTLSLREYQEETLAKEEIFFFKKGGKSGIDHLATGLGKTVITTHGIDRFWNPQKGHRSIIIGGINRLLTFQMFNSFQKHFPYLKGNQVMPGGQLRPLSGIVMDNLNQVDARVLVASIQTLTSGVDLTRLKRPNNPLGQPITDNDIRMYSDGSMRLAADSLRPFLISPRMDQILAAGGTFDVWIHDEAHHAVADGTVYIVNCLQQIRALYDLPPMKIIGNTATPGRADDRGLHTLFETVIVSYGIPWGQRHGYLVPFADPERVLIDEVEVDNDGNGSPLGQKQTIQYVSNWAEIVVQAYKDRMQGRRCFGYWSKYNGPGAVEDSIWVTNVMNAHGIRAAHLDGEKCIGPDGYPLPKSAQGRLLQMLAEGQLDVINNFNVLTEGVDLPRVDGILLGRRIDADNPTLMTQIIGRGLRPAQDKQDLKLLEFTGQQLAINSVANLMGYTVDPTNGQFKEDLDTEQIVRDFMRIWQQQPELVEKWILIQRRFAESTIREAIEVILRGSLDELQPAQIRALSDCVAYLGDEDRLLEGLDLRDVREEGFVRGVNQTYELTKIVTRSEGAWFADHSSAIMSLSIGENDSLFVHPPNHTLARLALSAQDIFISALTGSNGHLNHPLVVNKTPEQLQNNQIFFDKAVELLSNFTLWHLTGKPWNPVINGQIWVLSNDSLDVLTNDALSYARDHVTSYVAAFAEKKKARSWAKQPPTDAQLKLLASVMRCPVAALPAEYTTTPDQGGVGRGGVAKLITHHAGVPLVEAQVARFIQAVNRLKELDL